MSDFIHELKKQAEERIANVDRDWQLKQKEFKKIAAPATEIFDLLSENQNPQEVPHIEDLVQAFHDFNNAAKEYKKNLSSDVDDIKCDILRRIEPRTSTSRIEIENKIRGKRNILGKEEKQVNEKLKQMREALVKLYDDLFKEFSKASQEPSPLKELLEELARDSREFSREKTSKSVEEDVEETYQRKRGTLVLASMMISEEFTKDSPFAKEEYRIRLQTIQEDYQQFLLKHPEIFANYADKKEIYEFYDGLDTLIRANDGFSSIRDNTYASIIFLQEASAVIHEFNQECRKFIASLDTLEISEIKIGDDHPCFPLFTQEEKEKFRKNNFSLKKDLIRAKLDQLSKILENPNSILEKPMKEPIRINDHTFDYSETLVGVSFDPKTYRYDETQITRRDIKQLGRLISDPKAAQVLIEKINQEVEEIVELPISSLLFMRGKS